MDNIMIFTKALATAQVYALYKSQSGNMIDHDAAGNMITDKDGYLYDYDGENRIVKISRGDGDSTPTTVATFDYNALGRRIYAYDAIAGAGRYFCYNNNWQVLQEYNTAGSFAWANVFGNYIDEVLVRSATSSKYYYAHNHLYGPVAVMDFTAGTVLERYDYDAYGATHIMDASYTARTASAVGNPYSFTGRELDTLDSGNLKTMHYRHRSYDPFVGRFEQEDPFGMDPSDEFLPEKQYLLSLNLLTYIGNAPLMNTDPLGLVTFDRDSCISSRWCSGGPAYRNKMRAMMQSIRSACNSVNTIITNPTLAACIKNKCENSTISCKAGKQGSGGYNNTGSGIEFYPDEFNRGGNYISKITGAPFTAGETVLHEYAHECGWVHNDRGEGVPSPQDPAPELW
jgi:RHS repeat-associated protein